MKAYGDNVLVKKIESVNDKVWKVKVIDSKEFKKGTDLIIPAHMGFALGNDTWAIKQQNVIAWDI